MKMLRPVMCYTDYPLWLSAIPFKDRVNKELPWPEGEPTIYHVELVSYDGNKYAVVRHEKYGLVDFKAGYLYWHRYFAYLDSKPLPLTILNSPRFVDAIPQEDFQTRGVVCI